MPDIVEMMACENGELDEEQEAKLFQQLVLLITAASSWQDTMIPDKTLARVLREIAYWLEFN